jgi:hypothetical protein
MREQFKGDGQLFRTPQRIEINENNIKIGLVANVNPLLL